MSSKKAKAKAAPTDDELNQLLEGIETGTPTRALPSQSQGKSSSAPVPAHAQSEQQLLAELDELENLGALKPASRPHTPAAGGASKREAPGIGSARTSEDKARSAVRRSGESARSTHTSTAALTPSATSSEAQETEQKTPLAQLAESATATTSGGGGGGGWWGGIFATASAAVNTASAAVKEMQSNEEAQRWASQVRGNVGALRGFGDELRSRALPTFTNILHTLAPPISSHERLNIHITHDFIGYPSLDPLIHATFSRVMAQVEGGDLLVIQRGQEFMARRNSDSANATAAAGWNDGPWWRQTNEHRDPGCVKGLIEGTKLVRVSAEAYANEFFSRHGGLELASKKATEDLSESNPVRSSDIFLAVQAITHESTPGLFQPSKQERESTSVVEDETPDELVSFAVYLHDPVHSITFSTLSQSVPSRWIHWLDAPVPMTPASSASPVAGSHQASSSLPPPPPPSHALPEEIAQIIDSGGVDPREWVAEWVEELLSLATGVVAQRYVARRMGVGEGGLGRGKAREEQVLGDGGGEAARAGLI